MSAVRRPIERVVRRAPLGMRLWDTATATHLIDGLRVEVAARSGIHRRTRAFVNPSGIYCALGLPGLHDFERDDNISPDAWNQPQRRFSVEVRDPVNRFFPLSFDASLPFKGLLDPLASLSPPEWLLPPLESPLSPLSSPAYVVRKIPLFSAPSRPVPDSLAVLRAELREYPSERPAAWCLLQATINGAVRGMGLSDREGRAAVLFPYPPSPRPTLTSPASPRNDFRWTLSLTAYYQPPPAGALVPEVPHLTDLMASSDFPREPLSTLLPLQRLGPVPLEYGVPLRVRTWTESAERSSYLFIDVS